MKFESSQRSQILKIRFFSAMSLILVEHCFLTDSGFLTS